MNIVKAMTVAFFTALLLLLCLWKRIFVTEYKWMIKSGDCRCFVSLIFEWFFVSFIIAVFCGIVYAGGLWK